MSKDILRLHLDIDKSQALSSSQLQTREPFRQGQHEGSQHFSKHRSNSMSDGSRFFIRLVVFLACLSFLVIGRAVLPDHDVMELRDCLMDVFDGANEYIRGHRKVQDALLIICSLFMDIMFFSTGFYWVFKGHSSRLIVATLSFYFLRSAVQQMFYSPYPKNYVWDDPGFISLVVPYGRSTDFFFSGHLGLTVICACEWFRWKKYWAVGLILTGGIYTAIIMLVYQAHYSIDLFTGIICGHWMFMIIDSQKERIDAILYLIYDSTKRLFQIIFSCGQKNETHQQLN